MSELQCFSDSLNFKILGARSEWQQGLNAPHITTFLFYNVYYHQLVKMARHFNSGETAKVLFHHCRQTEDLRGGLNRGPSLPRFFGGKTLEGMLWNLYFNKCV